MEALCVEDAVCGKDSKGYKCGIVLETANDWSSDEDEAKGSGMLRRGTAVVVWHPSGKEETVKESTVKLVDRYLTPGDIVKKSSSGAGKAKGLVCDITAKCQLQILGTNQVIYNVDSKYLLPFVEWQTTDDDLYVTMDGWVGMVSHVEVLVSLSFTDGALCLASSELLDGFHDTADTAMRKRERSEFTNRNFYDGQKLRGLLADLRDAEWVISTVKHSAERAEEAGFCQVTVNEASVERVTVHWARSERQPCNDPTCNPPPQLLTRSELGRLRKLSANGMYSAQVGDQMYYTIRNGDVIHSLDPKRGRTMVHYVIEHASQQRKEGPSVTMGPAPIACTSTSVNNAIPGNARPDSAQHGHSQDSDYSLDVSDNDEKTASTTAGSKRTHNHSKGKRTKKSSRSRRGKRKNYGKLLEQKSFTPGMRVAVEIILRVSWCEVLWQNGSTESDIPSYDLCQIGHLDELEFFPGDFICHTQDAAGSAVREYGVILSVDEQRVAKVRWFTLDGSTSIPSVKADEAEVSVYEICRHPTYAYHPGQIVMSAVPPCQQSEKPKCANDLTGVVVPTVNVAEGKVNVRWADGCLYNCYPEELLYVGDMYHPSNINYVSPSDNVEKGSVRGSSDEWTSADESGDDIMFFADIPSDLSATLSASMAVDLALLKTDEAVEMETEGTDGLVKQEEECANVAVEYEIRNDQQPFSSGESCKPLHDGHVGTEPSIAEDHNDSDAIAAEEAMYSSSGFSVLSCPTDLHHFALSDATGTTSKEYLAAIRREMKLLSGALPDGMYVKGFESRLDLLSAMIIGPKGTPYEDGIFLFDILMKPGDWPAKPPQVHFHSYCTERLNPNLYENGKVCVSLLGTWSGKENTGELWTKDSTILQVLVSIQGLILVREPYFNEPGYERERGTQLANDNSKLYNEMAIVKTLQSLIAVARKPPKAFAQEVTDHIKAVGSRLVQRLTKWINMSDSPTSTSGIASTGDADLADKPEFILLPGSRGFVITLRKHVADFEELLKKSTFANEPSYVADEKTISTEATGV